MKIYPIEDMGDSTNQTLNTYIPLARVMRTLAWVKIKAGRRSGSRAEKGSTSFSMGIGDYVNPKVFAKFLVLKTLVKGRNYVSVNQV